MGSTATTATTNGVAPKITLYTNHGCPWAHRAHAALKELNLPYEEVIIDLDRPRDEWYLKINPRGLVPAMRYSNGLIDEIITESGIVSQFLADAHPSHLLPASHSSPTAPLVRARIAFFVDTYFTKVNPGLFALMGASTQEEKESKANDFVKAVEKEIEPLLKDADPFFGGSKELTMAEVLTASFIIRLFDFSDGEIFPTSLAAALEKLPAFSKWAKASITHESVTFIWDAQNMRKRTKERLPKYRAMAAAKAK